MSPGHAGLFGTALPDMAEARPVIVATTHLLHTAQPSSRSAASPTLCPEEGMRAAFRPCCCHTTLWQYHVCCGRHQVGEEPEDEEEQQLRALQLEDLEDHGTVGAGTSGVVNKVVHLPTGRTLALKVRRSASGHWFAWGRPLENRRPDHSQPQHQGFAA